MSGERIARGLRWAVVVAVIGLAATLAGAFLVSARAFFAGWLAAYVYWISLPLTALALLMIHDLIGGDWGVVLRPLLEAAAARVQSGTTAPGRITAAQKNLIERLDRGLGGLSPAFVPARVARVLPADNDPSRFLRS